MRVLLDNNVNQRFARLLLNHEAVHSRKMGWAELHNGDLIAAAEEEGFDAIVMTDKRMEYQQNLKGRRISIIVLNSRRITLKQIAPLAGQVNEALKTIPTGSFITIDPDI